MQMRDGEQLNFSPDFAKPRSLCNRSICSPISFFCCCVFWSKLTFRDKNEIKKRRKIFDEREKGFLSICFYLFCVRSFISMKIKWEVHFPGKKIFIAVRNFPNHLKPGFKRSDEKPGFGYFLSDRSCDLIQPIRWHLWELNNLWTFPSTHRVSEGLHFSWNRDEYS